MVANRVSSTLGRFLNECLTVDQNICDMENLYKKTIKEVERILINKVMQFTNFNKSRSARILGISRNTLDAKLNILKTFQKHKCLSQKNFLER